LETTIIILLLLLAVVVSSIIERASPFPIPLPFAQITLGALIAWAFDFNIVLAPEFFLLLFIAPLLFLDGWRTPKEGLLHDKWIICALAFGLVFFTVIGAGLFIHWMIPAMPLAIAFALAAVLSPTDAVAVSAIAARSPLPKRLLHILEGESLLNDASGLVCLRFAVAAALTGAFSITEASLAFLWVVAAGIAVGIGVTVLANVAKDWIAQRFGEETGSQILISLLIPFGAYIAAEHLHASGILAAVAAGIAMNREERSGRARAVTRVRRAAVWDAVQFAANGVIFVLLGQQLPGILAGASAAIDPTGHENTLWLLLYVLAVSVVLATLRALWAWATLQARHFRTGTGPLSFNMRQWQLVAVTTLAGARGAVTLSGVMTLPLALQDAAAFPRDLAIALAAGVIVVSLVTANVGLPLVMRGVALPRGSSEHREKDEARQAAAAAAIKAIEHDLMKASYEGADAVLHREAGERVLAQYRQRADGRTANMPDRELLWRVEEIEHGLLRLAFEAERHELYRFAQAGRLTDETVRHLVRDIDLQETRISER
jgi:CPA1 family monovalent cation:H+ antiporter